MNTVIHMYNVINLFIVIFYHNNFYMIVHLFSFSKIFFNLVPVLILSTHPVICLLYGNSDEYTIYMCLYSFSLSFIQVYLNFFLYNVHAAHCRIFEIMSLKLFSKLKQRSLLVGLKGYGHYLNWRFPNLILDFHCQFWFMFVIP